MRIISKFNDYYDSVQAYGFDSRILYKRKKGEFKFYQEFEDIFDLTEEYRRFTHYDNIEKLQRLIIGFCGKIYPVIKVEYTVNPKYKESFNVVEYCYDYNSVEALLMKIDPKIFKKKKRIVRYRDAIGDDLKNIKKSFVKYNGCEDYAEIFFKVSAPIFLIDTIYNLKYITHTTFDLKTNICLKDVQFYKLFDTFSTSQMLSMYLSEILHLNDPDIVEIEEKYRMKQKGFDKTSFRKNKHQSKPRNSR